MKKERFPRRRFSLCGGLGMAALVLLSSACQHQETRSTVTPAGEPEKVLVLPFQNMAARFPGAEAVRSPIGGKVFPVGEITEGAEDLLTEQVVDLLRQREPYEILNPGRARAVLSRMSLTNEDLAPDREMIVRIGTLAGADLALAGFVYRYRERVGTAYGVRTPASVAFDLHLMDIPTGRLLWSAAFDETQLSLSEDLFQFDKFLSRKGRWVTAGQMARAALERAFQSFP